MDDRQAAANSMMKLAASLKMDDAIIEIEVGANTSTNASPGRQALADSIRKSVNESISKLRSGDPPTIYKVPQRIREVNDVAYEPKMVSIGPYHHGKKRLQGMEENKCLYLHSFLSRNPDHRLEDYLKAMEELEDKARSCYSDNIDPQVDKYKFVKMMVLDACFIIELFLRFDPMENRAEFLKEKKELEQKEKELEQNEEDLGFISAMEFFFPSNGFEDPIGRTIGMLHLIGYDILLLENQIPFFVLQRIFEMACREKEPHLLEMMALQFLDEFMPINKKIKINDSYYHLLHLFHSHLIPTPNDGKEKHNLLCNPIIKYVLNMLKNLLMFLPCSKETSSPNTESREMIPCATDLQLAGVKFKKIKKSNNILNVKFSHGVLEITPFLIHDHSDTLFRNLVAFEQCCLQPNIHFFTTYIVFMDFLVNTSNDVALLHQNGIIDNLLGSDDEVAHLFNRLCIGIFHTFKGSYLEDVNDNVQKHSENRWNMWRASLKRDYFTNPWSVISFIAAFILLLLTITQTFYSIFPYYRPRS